MHYMADHNQFENIKPIVMSEFSIAPAPILGCWEKSYPLAL